MLHWTPFSFGGLGPGGGSLLRSRRRRRRRRGGGGGGYPAHCPRQTPTDLVEFLYCSEHGTAPPHNPNFLHLHPISVDVLRWWLIKKLAQQELKAV